MSAIPLHRDRRDLRIEELEAEVGQLRRTLGIEEEAETTIRLMRLYRLPRGPALLLQLLLGRRGRVVTHDFADSWIPRRDAVAERASYDYLKVYVRDLRLHLGAHAVINERQVGYRLSMDSLVRIEKALEAFP